MNEEKEIYSEGIIATEAMSLDPEEEKQIREQFNKHKDYVCRRGSVIRKNALHRHEVMVIELKQGSSLGLMNTTIDREKNTLSGIRIFKNALKGWFYKKYVFSLDDYRQKWRAWDGNPAHGRPWRGRK